MRLKALIPVLLLAGCSNTAWQISGGQPHAASAAGIQVTTGAAFATLIGAAVRAVGGNEAIHGTPDAISRKPPEMAPDRKVQEVDCTRPVDWSLGNLRCK